MGRMRERFEKIRREQPRLFAIVLFNLSLQLAERLRVTTLELRAAEN